MRLQIRTLTGESKEIDLEPSATIADLKVAVEKAVDIPIPEQRLIYAGAQLEDVVTAAWKQKRTSGGGDVSSALGLNELPDGAPLRLEHYSIQKGSVIQVARGARAAAPCTSATEAVDDVAASQPASNAPDSGAPPRPEAALPRAAGYEASEYRSCKFSASPVSAGGPPGFISVPVVSGRVPEQTPGADMGGLDQTSRKNRVAVDPNLAKSLESLGDLELQALLSPLLARRPAVTKALVRDLQGTSQGAAPSRQPGSDGGYEVGRAISVWSNSAQKWFSGTVHAVATHDKGQIPAGAVEVTFELGTKWISPQDLKRTVRLL